MGMVSLAGGLRGLFLVLGCVITATVIYTISTDGLPFRKELLTPWMAATLVDFYINVLAIGAWVVYKESNWISAVVWVVLLVCLGRSLVFLAFAHVNKFWSFFLITQALVAVASITTCGYIVFQFLKLSSQESQEDPVYYVLLRHQKKFKWKNNMLSSIGKRSSNVNQDAAAQKMKYSVVIARVIFGALGFLMLGTLLYTIMTDGSPFHRDVLTPWLLATLIDFYINVVALSVWVAFKESSWISASLWIILLVCFGSISTCAYIVLQLFHLSSHDLIFLVLFSSSNRAGNGYETFQQGTLR